MAIYVTGDTHGSQPHGFFSYDGFMRRFNTSSFPEQKEMGKEDYVVICGDFGGVWDVDRFKVQESPEEKNALDWLESKMYVINDIHEMWYEQLQEGLEANGRTYTPEQMAELFYPPREDRVWARLDKLFTPGFYDYLLNVDITAPIPAGGNPFVDLHRALSENSLCNGWEPKHRIQFVHSRGDMVVPFANYLSFRDAHPGGEGSLYRIDDSITTDHIDTGVTFYLNLTTLGSYGKYFQWFDEAVPTGIADIDGLTPDPSLLRRGEIYNISGQRLSKPQKGINIVNGRKVAIK